MEDGDSTTYRRKTCLEAWQEIDLPNVQLSLDEQASKLADFREACHVSRRALAEYTKSFKRLESVRMAPEESVLRVQVPKLLRNYQEEVDRLTQRAKFSENCFLVIYRLIREVPDPGTELINAERKVFDAQTNLSKYLAEEGSIRNELEELKEQLKQKNAEIEALANQQDNSYEAEIERRVEQEKQRFKEKLLDEHSKFDEDSSNITMQLEMAQNEVERQNSRIAELEEELLQAKAANVETEMMAKNEKEKQIMKDDLKKVTGDLEESKQALAVLKAENETNKLSAASAKADYENQIEELNYLVKDRTEIVREMQKKLSSRPSVEEHQSLIRQLQVMQKVIYNGTDSDELPLQSELKGSENEEESENDTGLEGLEAWLLKSNKDLKLQLVEARKTIEDQNVTIERLKETELRLGEALQDQSELAKKLETDLTIAGNAAVEFRQEQTSASAASPGAGAGHEAQAHRAVKSMLDAVCAQRDRLRTAVQERDDKIEELYKQVRTATEKKKSLEEDNVQLYQRIKFLQNYKASERSTLLSDGVPTNDSMLESGQKPAGAKGLGRGVEHRYRKIYESIDENPFSVFKNQEKERLFKSIPTVERFTLKTYNSFLTRPRGRSFLAYYTIINHIVLIYLVSSYLFTSCSSSS